MTECEEKKHSCFCENEKEERIFRQIKKIAKERVGYGKITLIFSVNDGKIVSGELVSEVLSLG